MTPSEIQAESKRLQELAENLVNQSRGEHPLTFERSTLELAITLAYAIVFASIPAFVASFFVGIDHAITIFAALTVLIGCNLIRWELEAIRTVQAKQFDALNSLRLCLVDSTNRVSGSIEDLKHSQV